MHLMALRAFCLQRSPTLATMIKPSLNAPYGAPHFLTSNMFENMIVRRNRLNAPYDAPYFLTVVSNGGDQDNILTMS